MKNLLAKWFLGITIEDIIELNIKHIDLQDKIDALEAKKDEKFDPSDFVQTCDFDPSDYDFSPLNDYDFSEFLTPDNVDEQIECYLGNNCYITSDNIDEAVDDAITANERFVKLTEQIETLKDEIKALKAKPKRKPKKKLTTEEQAVKDHIQYLRGKKK